MQSVRLVRAHTGSPRDPCLLPELRSLGRKCELRIARVPHNQATESEIMKRERRFLPTTEARGVRLEKRDGDTEGIPKITGTAGVSTAMRIRTARNTNSGRIRGNGSCPGPSIVR